MNMKTNIISRQKAFEYRNQQLEIVMRTIETALHLSQQHAELVIQATTYFPLIANLVVGASDIALATLHVNEKKSLRSQAVVGHGIIGAALCASAIIGLACPATALLMTAIGTGASFVKRGHDLVNRCRHHNHTLNRYHFLHSYSTSDAEQQVINGHIKQLKKHRREDSAALVAGAIIAGCVAGIAAAPWITPLLAGTIAMTTAVELTLHNRHHHRTQSFGHLAPAC